jgi:hypothetical protein
MSLHKSVGASGSANNNNNNNNNNTGSKLHQIMRITMTACNGFVLHNNLISSMSAEAAAQGASEHLVCATRDGVKIPTILDSVRVRINHINGIEHGYDAAMSPYGPVA